INARTVTRSGKKTITPKQMKVTILSSVRPSRPTPSSARAAGAPRSIAMPAAQRTSRTRTGRLGYTTGNLQQGHGAIRASRGPLTTMPPNVEPRSAAAGHRPGAHRVPPDLVLGPPDPRPLAAGLPLPALPPRVQ